ncbi:uncharacterized protein EAF01_007926 [Botrytis porri]|uniref:Uncharacterized protein n=1 Tax=Botrytis porri TaxID=87229 RepID=A0A4Z1KSR3_9HELO|nr:uncharacterized protein EAF01_007926 [Botrytis porri]KAF7900624.1 hypothetical protein EAF01_007926 [Botrytis porri]TGO86215.1 hypothetical protein BPOR_0323g00080 [Botrytis porri]
MYQSSASLTHPLPRYTCLVAKEEEKAGLGWLGWLGMLTPRGFESLQLSRPVNANNAHDRC